MRTALPILLVLAACGQARATAPDPSNDVHCSVIAFYFDGYAEHVGAPAEQRRATRALHDWYAAKMRAVAGDRFADPAALQREVGPLLDAIKADPLAMRDELTACLNRALADPAFARR